MKTVFKKDNPHLQKD